MYHNSNAVFVVTFRSGGHYRLHAQRPPLEGFRGMSQSLLINVTVLFQIMPRRLPWASFPIFCSLFILSMVWAADRAVNITQIIVDWGSSRCSYGLDGPGIESRWGLDFSHQSWPALGPTQPPVQRVPGFSPGVKAAGAWRWPSTPSSAEVKERVELYFHSPVWELMTYSRMNFTLPKDAFKCKIATQFSGILQTVNFCCYGSSFKHLLMLCLHEFRNVNT